MRHRKEFVQITIIHTDTSLVHRGAKTYNIDIKTAKKVMEIINAAPQFKIPEKNAKIEGINVSEFSIDEAKHV